MVSPNRQPFIAVARFSRRSQWNPNSLLGFSSSSRGPLPKSDERTIIWDLDSLLHDDLSPAITKCPGAVRPTIGLLPFGEKHNQFYLLYTSCLTEQVFHPWMHIVLHFTQTAFVVH